MMNELPPSPTWSVVIPCFNEVESIERTLEELASFDVAKALEAIVVVDDGSTDGSGPLLDHLMAADVSGRLHVLHHRHRRGYGAAIKTAVRRVQSEIVIILDADGTYPVDRIPDLLREMPSVDMVVGARTGEHVEIPLLRRLPKELLRRFASWLVGESIPDVNSGFRAFRREAFNRYRNILPDGFSLTTTITIAMLRGGYQVRFISIDYAVRTGRSKIRPIADTLRFFMLVFRCGVYFAPLRVFGPVLILLFSFTMASGLYDTLILENLTDKTILLLVTSLNATLFTLLADMIDKRSG